MIGAWGGWIPPVTAAPAVPAVKPRDTFAVLSSAGVWWSVPRAGLVRWLSQRATGAPVPTWQSVGAWPLAGTWNTGFRPEDWCTVEVERALSDLAAGREPGLPEVST